MVAASHKHSCGESRTRAEVNERVASEGGYAHGGPARTQVVEAAVAACGLAPLWTHPYLHRASDFLHSRVGGLPNEALDVALELRMVQVHLPGGVGASVSRVNAYTLADCGQGVANAPWCGH